MVSKKMTAMLMIAMLSFLASSVMVKAATSTVWDYDGDYDGELEMSVEATTTADPGDSISVTVNYEAKEDLDSVKVYFYVTGTTGEGSDTWETDSEKVVKDDLDDGDDDSVDIDVDVDDGSDPGMIIGHITATWDYYDSGDDETYTRDLDLAFPLTYITGGVDDSTYTALQTKYTQLETKYNTLDNNYSTLEENSLELTASYDQLETSYNTVSANYQALQTSLEGLTSDYNTLENDLNTLETQYSSLQTQLTEVQNNYNTANTDLTNTRNYMYLFIVTTIIGLGAAVVMAMRGRK